MHKIISTYAKNRIRLVIAPALKSFNALCDRSSSTTTDLDIQLSMQSAQPSLLKTVSNQAVYLESLHRLKDDMRRKYFRLKGERKQLIAKIRAYLKKRRRWGRGIDSDLTDLPIDIDSFLNELYSELKSLGEQLVSLFRSLGKLGQQIFTVRYQIVQQTTDLQQALTQIADQTHLNILSDLMRLNYTQQHAHLLHPAAKLCTDLQHIDLDAFMSRLQAHENDPSMHHGRIIRLLHLVAYMHKHPELAKSLGIENLSACTPDQLHDAVKIAKQHALYEVIDQHWEIYDNKCTSCSDKHMKIMMPNQEKLIDMREQFESLREKIANVEARIIDCQNRWNTMWFSTLSLVPLPRKETQSSDLESNFSLI